MLPPQTISKPIQISFAGGVNPAAPAHLVGESEVATATNIDFSLSQGALIPRRGSTNIAVVGTGTSPVTSILHNYNSGATILNGGLYWTDLNGNVYRGSGGTGGVIVSGARANDAFPTALGAFEQYTVISGNGKQFKDDGTLTTEWIKQQPSAPTLVVQTLTPISLTGTWSLSVGTLVSTTGTSATFASNVAGNATIILNFGSATDISVNGTNSIGNYGVNFINVAFSDPTTVTKISWDYSIGDATFYNYWHYELAPQDGGVDITDSQAQTYINAQTEVGTGTVPITQQERFDILSQISQYNFHPLSFISNVSSVLSPWAVTVPQFELVAQNLVGTAGADLWKAIYALRISIECGTDTSTCTVASPQIYGAENYPLTDINTGYTYWDTWATLDSNGNKVDEGAPSLSVGPVLAQNARIKVTHTGTATGTQHGITHVITYRQGGYMQDAYAISTQTYGTGGGTSTDTMSDIDALSNGDLLERNLMSPSLFPGFVIAIADGLVADRLFFSDINLIRWTLPGQLGSIPLTSYQEVSNMGDAIQGILTWNPGLIIVNRSSVYEMQGTDFEEGLYTLQRSGSRRGSLAAKTIIRTPHGIPLLSADGLSMYVPGYATDQEIPWFMDKYGDIFKGTGTSDPAALKGNRIPAMNTPYILHSIAAYRDRKLYLGLPTGTSTYPNTVFVLDWVKQNCYWYTYPFNITSWLADDRITTFWAGTTDGTIKSLEDGLSDSGTAITWHVRTREWTADTDTCLENIAISAEGTAIEVRAYYDDSTNPILDTLSSVRRTWQVPALNGTFINSVAFDFNGTSNPSGTTTLPSSVYEMAFDLLSEPVRVHYYRTAYADQAHTADKLWDVAYFDIEILNSHPVKAVTFIDNIAIMTNTFNGPTGGRVVIERAFPAETYGRIAYTTYTCAG